MWDDGWTVLTADGSRCAQFEHTLVVTENGAEVLNASVALLARLGIGRVGQAIAAVPRRR